MKIFTYNELIDFILENYKDYTLFLEGKICKRHDGSYICGTRTIHLKEIVSIEKEKENSIYKDNIYLLTDIDIFNQFITFNEIGTKEEILQYLEKEVY